MKKVKLVGCVIYLRHFTLIILINFLVHTPAFGDSFSDFYTPSEQFLPSRSVDLPFFGLLLPTPVHCNALSFQADLIDNNSSNDIGTDGIDESYKMVSLLECNGANYVSPVKRQIGGSCGWYSRTAGLETLLGVFYANLRPVTNDHNLSDFLPVNLSEGYLLYSKEGSGNRFSDVLSDINTSYWTGITTHDAFYPDQELQLRWGEWDQQKADILNRRYGQISEYCRVLDGPQPPHDSGRFIPIFNCLFDVAKNKHLVFIKEKDEVNIPADMCYDTLTGRSAGKCNTLSNYGAFGDQYQVDYALVDKQIKGLISGGRPVRASIYSEGYKTDKDVSVSINPHYDFKLIVPQPLLKFEQSGSNYNYKIRGKKYKFTLDHSVLIVGYLEGINKDFWIIKNSHTNNVINNREPDEFLLVGTASTSGEIDEPYSTKRIFFLDANNPNSKYDVQTDVEFVRLNPGIDTIDKVLATSNNNYVLHDQDGDGVVDFFDNCPEIPNDQNDSDGDFVGDACDPCPNNYERFQNLSDPNIFVNDVDEDCIPRLCDTLSPTIVGFSLIELNASLLSPHRGFSWSLGEREHRNLWGFALNQEVIGVGDMDGDGRDDFMLRSSWGISVIKASGTGFSLIDLMKDGLAIGSWTVDKNDTYYGPGDFDGDGKEEFVIFNADSSRLGIVDLNSSNKLSVLKTYSARDLMGAWRLDENNVISGVGDFDGDGKDEFIIRSSWGMGIIGSTGGGVLKDLIKIPLGTRLGGWYFHVDDRVGAVGDYNGDGQDDIILQSTSGLNIVTLSSRHSLISMTIVSSGSWLGQWHYGAGDEIVAVLNADADNEDEFVLKSPWGIGIIDRKTNGRLRDKVMVKFGDSLQDWYLSKDDRIVAVGNLDGAGPDEFIMQSQHGIGVIGINNTAGKLTSISIHPYNSWLGDWFLRPENVVLGIGDFVSSGKDELMIKTLDP